MGNNQKLKIVGGLWPKNSPAAGDYWTGAVMRDVKPITLRPGDKIRIFRNKKAKHPNAPPFLLYVEELEKTPEREVYKTSPPPNEEDGGFGGFGSDDEGAPF